MSFKLSWGLPDEAWHWVDALSVVSRHLELTEQQTELIQHELDQEWRHRVEKAGDEWDCIDGTEYEYEKSIVSRVLCNSFLISLFSVHESITKDITCEAISHECPEKVNQLRCLRNAIVHKNGRFDSFNEQQKSVAQNYIGKGLEVQDGYVVLSRDFLSNAFCLVKDELEALMERYTDWKISQK